MQRRGVPSRRLVCRTLSLAAMALAAAPLGGLAQSQPAAAQAPTSTAYWVKLGLAPPTVPKGGLLVANDPTSAVSATAPASPLPAPVPAPPAPPPPPKGLPAVAGPTAVSTVLIEGATAGADATLTLKVAPGSLPPLPSTTTMVACAVRTSWSAPAGGSGDISKAPLPDCSSPSTGRVATDNGSVSWLLPASFQEKPGTLNVELLPNPSGPPAPFAVAFVAPDTRALQSASGPPAAEAPPPTPLAQPVGAPAPSFDVSSALPAPLAYTPAEPRGVAVSRPAGPRQITLVNPASLATPLADDRGHRIMAVAALFLIAGAWWWVGSRPTRAPRLLGALAAPGAGGAAVAVRTGGVGRFARLRIGGPRRI